jgi:hypothetical protein
MCYMFRDGRFGSVWCDQVLHIPVVALLVPYFSLTIMLRFILSLTVLFRHKLLAATLDSHIYIYIYIYIYTPC